MLILLPPSEGKTAVAAGPPLDVDTLSLPQLNPTRRKVLDALVRLANGQPTRARRVLRLSEHQTAELERDRDLLTAPTAAAADIYSGVLFDALDYRTLSAPARRRLDQWVVVSSALWGAIRLADRIPPYRLSNDVALPRIGAAARVWGPALKEAIPTAATDGVILDLRSGGYAKMWKPTGELADRTVVARIMQRRPDGSVMVVSHHNKATKGRLLRALAAQRTAPRTVQALADTVTAQGYDAALCASGPGQVNQLDIVVNEV